MIETDKATSEILAEMDALSAALSLEDRQVCEEGSQPKRVEEQEDTWTTKVANRRLSRSWRLGIVPESRAPLP